MSSAMTPDPVGNEAAEEELRRKVERLRAHRSRPVAGAVEMELSSGTARRCLRRLAMASILWPAILPSLLRPGRCWVLLALVCCAAGLPLHGGNAEELAVAGLGLEPLLVSCAAGLPLHYDDRVSGEVLRDGQTMPDWNPDRDLDTRILILGQWAARAMAEDRARRDAVAARNDLRGPVTKVAAAVRAQLDGAKNQVPLIPPRSPLRTRGDATAHPQVRGKSGAEVLALVGLDVRLAGSRWRWSSRPGTYVAGAGTGCQRRCAGLSP